MQSTNNKKEHMSLFLPYSCSACHEDSNDVVNCEFKATQNIKIDLMQCALEPSNKNNNSLDNVTVVDLKDICRAHGLSAGGLKKDLVARLSEFMESLVVHDDNDAAAAELLEECEA